VGLRIQRGLPRGGIGYLGIPLGIAAVVAAIKLDPSLALSIAGLAVPLCFWLGLGLRLDGDCDEVTDHVISESRRHFDYLGIEDRIVSVFRISTDVILLGLASLAVSLWRWAGVK
jgi:hypothetical protein